MELLLRNAIIKIFKNSNLRVFYIDLIYHSYCLFLHLMIYFDTTYHHPYLFLRLRIYSDVVTYFVFFFSTFYDIVFVA